MAGDFFIRSHLARGRAVEEDQDGVARGQVQVIFDAEDSQWILATRSGRRLGRVARVGQRFGVLELDLLASALSAYGQKVLWAAVGWFLERDQRTFFVRPEYLTQLERHHPKAPQYLLRNERGGVKIRRWNLAVPEYIERGAEADEPRP